MRSRKSTQAVRSGPKGMRVALVVGLPALALLVWGFLPGAGADKSPLALGADAFERGSYDESIEHFTAAGLSGRAALEGRFNAGVAALKNGKTAQARAFFEETSAAATGELRSRALANLAQTSYLLAQAGEREAGEAGAKAGDDPTAAARARIEKLAAAAALYKAAAEFFAKVEPFDADAEHNVGAAKTALRRVIDAAMRIEEDEKLRAEAKALEKPGALLVSLFAREKTHLRLSRALAEAPRGRQRIGSRRLRKAEAEVRILTEKLRQFLERPETEGEPKRPPEETEQRQKAAAALGRAIEAQRLAELAHGRAALSEAAAQHLEAARELRGARVFFPLDIAELVAASTQTADAVVQAGESLEAQATSGLSQAEVKGSGFGKQLIEALKEKVLEPVARLLGPSHRDEAMALADDEDDVVWGASILAHAEIPPTPAPAPAPAGGAPPGAGHEPPGAGGQPELSPEAAKELSAAVRKEGAAAEDAASKAREHLRAERVGEALPPAREALAALERLAQLLPKPPVPVEERLKELLERQRRAEEAAGGLKDLEEAPRRQGATALAASQRRDGAEAESVREELGARQNDERAAKAAAKVGEGALAVFSSAEAMDRLRTEEGKDSVHRAVEALAEALAILSGQDEKEEQPEEDGKDPSQKQDQSKDGESEDKPDEAQSLALDPRQARMLEDEMDRKRRAEEARLFRAPSSVSVEKDW